MKLSMDFLWDTLSSWVSTHELNRQPSYSKATDDLFQHSGRKFLHVGCGSARKPDVGPGFLTDEWAEVRLDIDPAASPDIVSSMLDMALVPSASVEAVYSHHNIEHLYPHEVSVALLEFFRVLKEDGLLVLACPDLQSLCSLIVDDKLDQPAYLSDVGPITPLDVLYGHRPQLAEGNLFMAHHTGFTLRTLVETVRDAGFRSVAGRRRDTSFDLWVVAAKQHLPEQEIQALMDIYLPQ
ncbi:MAG: class I SAM-dependent methyltransferase [Methylobacter sp.]